MQGELSYKIELSNPISHVIVTQIDSPQEFTCYWFKYTKNARQYEIDFFAQYWDEPFIVSHHVQYVQNKGAIFMETMLVDGTEYVYINAHNPGR